MTTVHDLQEQLEQIDSQILTLLQDRVKLVTNAASNEEPAEEDALETLSFWTEEASDYGLDETIVEKITKLVILLGKKVEDE